MPNPFLSPINVKRMKALLERFLSKSEGSLKYGTENAMMTGKYDPSFLEARPHMLEQMDMRAKQADFRSERLPSTREAMTSGKGGRIWDSWDQADEIAQRQNTWKENLFQEKAQFDHPSGRWDRTAEEEIRRLPLAKSDKSRRMVGMQYGNDFGVNNFRANRMGDALSENFGRVGPFPTDEARRKEAIDALSRFRRWKSQAREMTTNPDESPFDYFYQNPLERSQRDYYKKKAYAEFEDKMNSGAYDSGELYRMLREIQEM